MSRPTIQFLLTLTLFSSLAGGCTLIAEVDRTKIEDEGLGGASGDGDGDAMGGDGMGGDETGDGDAS
jgi:hypothetical protein